MSGSKTNNGATTMTTLCELVIDELEHQREVKEETAAQAREDGDDKTAAWATSLAEAFARVLTCPTIETLSSEPLAIQELENSLCIWRDNLECLDGEDAAETRRDVRTLKAVLAKVAKA